MVCLLLVSQGRQLEGLGDDYQNEGWYTNMEMRSYMVDKNLGNFETDD